jgi:cation:H+ antiporter
MDKYVCRIKNGFASVQPEDDVIGESMRKVIYPGEPKTYMIFAQLFMGLAGIIVGATLFVGQINAIAEVVGLNPTILALIVAPIATELPEKFNSFIWISQGKDTYAIGNITGAMVFQSCIPVTIGIALTSWHLDLTDTVNALMAVSIGIALLTGAVLYLRSTQKELHISGLMMGGVMYLFFLVLVLLTVA